MAILNDRRDDYLYIRWAAEVKRKDNFQCAICGRQGIYLESHHKNAWNDYPDERYDIENGVTLCAGSFGHDGFKGCHDRFHEIYGKGGNTESQFEEFEELSQALYKFSSKKALKKAIVSEVMIKLILDRRKDEKDGYESEIQVSTE